MWAIRASSIRITGRRSRTTLANTVGAGALLTLVEGFTDWEEDAALFRVRNLDTNGASLAYSQTYYDYPNQRISILREHSRNPFPTTLKFEAEGCDTFGGANGGNGQTNYYRNGNIAIATTTDTGGGNYIGWLQSGEWFEWQHVPLNGTPHFLVRVASPNANMTMHLVIDGAAKSAKPVPNTGGWQTWTTFDLGTYGSFTNSYHTIRFVFDTGGANFNWWQTSTAIPTFYTDSSFSGTAVSLGVGTYTLSQMVSLGLPNDSLSSVKVPSGYTVTLYHDDNFSGTSLTLTADNAHLSDNGFNDQTSSIRITSP